MSRFIKRIMILTVSLVLVTGSAGAADRPVDSAAALTNLLRLSDSIQTVMGKALKDSDIDALRQTLPADLGIVLSGGKSVSGHDATNKYGELLIDTFGGGELSTKRERSGWMQKTENYAHELIAYDFTRTAADSTEQKWDGHITVYWMWSDGEWQWKRLFISRR